MSKTILNNSAVRKNLLPMALALLLVAALSANFARSQEPAETATARELIAMLRQFLDDAAHNNAAGFDLFFADDVIYTRSTGAVITKSDLVRGVGSARPSAPSNSSFSAEDITVHEYPNMAVVAFRLVSRTEHGDRASEVSNYRNTGIFLRRNNKWQVIAWQSTKIPEATAPK